MAVSIKAIPLAQLLPTLHEPRWSRGPLYFVGDVGGTNARLGFGHQPKGGESGEPAVSIIFVHFRMTRKDVGQLAEFFETILKAIRADPRDQGRSILSRIASGALSVPGPVTRGGTFAGPFNNLNGVTDLTSYPTELFPPGRSSLLNDLQAGGFGVLAVSDANAFDSYFTQLWVGPHAPPASKKTLGLGGESCLVVSPGTGLGVSLVHPVGQTKSSSSNNGDTDGGAKSEVSYNVMPLEFGSVTLPYRRGREKYMIGLSEFIRGRHKDTNTVRLPVAEDGCCGGAIVYNYYLEKVKREPGTTMPKSLKASPLAPEQVVSLAKEKDPIAMHALTAAYESLMTTCGEAVMTFLPMTVAVIGDNVVRNSFFFEDQARVNNLQKVLYDQPMQEQNFISRATFIRQTKTVNLNLLGCFGFGTRTAQSGASTAATQPPSKL